MHLETQEVVLKGNPICRGIAIGKLFFLDRCDFKVSEKHIPAAHVDREIERYRMALSRSKQDIKRLQKQLELESAMEGIAILDAQLEMLQDPFLTIEVEKEVRITEKNVEFIFQKTLTQFQDRFDALKDPFFAERFKDLQDLARRIFSYLQESGHLSLYDVPPYSIVCAFELTASDVAEAKSASVCAFITESGGATSHPAIVAKGKGIPFITRISLDQLKLYADAPVIVDGRTGLIILYPKPETLKKYESLKEKMHHQTQHLEQMSPWPAETYDGYQVRLLANLDLIHEIDLIHQWGGQGIGLFRSEYIFLPSSAVPSEQEQFQIYSHIVKKMRGLPVVIRTFDLGGDKAHSQYAFTGERTPFLSGRSTRFLLQEKDILRSQLRAILKASTEGDVRVLFPMISTLSELRQAKQMMEEIKNELNLTHKIPTGCMIEVPSAALITDHFAKECDFLSIGTNDLVQYALAIDRSDHTVNESYEPTDPSVIRLIKLITSEANNYHVPVTVCGEIASDPRFIPLLLGLGVQELSVAPRYLPLIKNAIRNTSIVDAIHLAEKALCLTTAQEVLNLLSHEYQKNVPQDLLYNP